MAIVVVVVKTVVPNVVVNLTATVALVLRECFRSIPYHLQPSLTYIDNSDSEKKEKQGWGHPEKAEAEA